MVCEKCSVPNREVNHLVTNGAKFANYAFVVEEWVIRRYVVSDGLSVTADYLQLGSAQLGHPKMIARRLFIPHER